ncbi:hypothetical protein [Adhaeribacter soli]|uniref:Uncharacterized protein n=1 Tax=Adhaeribacter soli TaxID=2607655 RepID=A0A5N1J3B6_9BACT|nr:hypothetical protein [Adhaeribacter soli]KAA9341022.1 hypothetical protein F0P94_06240 [Adhaeribacter soli]
MLQLQSLHLKFLYHLTGFPVIILVILTPEKLEKGPQQIIWWSLVAAILVLRLLLQKEKYQNGTFAVSWKTTLLAIVAAGAFGLFSYSKFF